MPAVGNGLLNALIACWPGDEASGNALDSHTNGLDLTDNNTVTNDTGLVYATARQYTRANTEHHRRPGDDALLSTGDVDYTFAAWVYMDSKASVHWILSKWVAAGGAREYMIQYHNTPDRFRLYVRNIADTDYGIATANNFGSPSISTWYLVIAWHDAANDQVGISVNDGTSDLVAFSGGSQDSGSRFQISGYNGISSLFNGRIGPTAFWKSAAAGGGVLTAAQRTALYNSGAGLEYESFTT